ncbi:MAG: hypothetical protein HZC02_00670 [Candidatus Levybacteria bacterium]|nr:hypothetical protein [Candidatus Levybacteria bacterium]
MKKSQKRKSLQKNAPSVLLTRVTLVALGSVLLLAFAQTLVQKATLHFDDPTKVLGASVLGDDSSGNESEDEKENDENDEQDEDKTSSNSVVEEQKKEDELQKEQEKERQKAQKESEKKQSRTSRSNTSKTVTPTKSVQIRLQKEGAKQEVEIETSDGQKIKTKTEDDGTTKVELEHGELKIRYKIINGEIVKKVEDDNGDEVELEDDQLNELEDEVEQELEDQGIELSSRSGRPSFKHNNVAALTEFPLSVDVGTNELLVTTSNGVKTIAILPDEALKTIMTQKIVTFFDSENSGTPEDDGEASVALKVINDKPVYVVSGSKEYKLFALLPVSQKVKAVVSAETGQVVGVEKSFVTNVIDLLSP